jgi:pilus assembly protein Flp/PilA
MRDYRDRALAMLIRLKGDKRGQDLIEYALMAGFVTIAVAAFFPTTLAPMMRQVFSKIGEHMTKAANQG